VKRFKLSQFKGGWFIGDFEPSLLRSESVEVCFKEYFRGDSEPTHHQRSALEITLIISGTCSIKGEIFMPGDICLLGPLEAADFQALTDVRLVAVKSPSIPSDKVLGVP
jgi:hypothetical protein